jgi:hypothetical protein
MKKLTVKLLYVALLLTLFSCSEAELKAPEKQDYFLKLYGNFHKDHLSDIDMTEEGNIVLTGYRNNVDDKEEAWIIKTDEQGMTSWEKIISGNQNYKGYSLLVDEKIYHLGCQENPDSDIQIGSLYSFGSDGTIVDSLKFDIYAQEVKGMKFLKRRSNLRFIVHVHNKQDEVYIYEVTGQDNINKLSENQLHDDVNGQLYYYEQDNGNIFLTGTTNEIGTNEYTDIMVASLENNKIAWSFNYGENESIERASGILLKDDQLYVAGSEANNDDQDCVHIFKLTKDGEKIDRYDLNLEGQNISYDFTSKSGDEFLFTGVRKIDNKNSKIFLARTSLKGTIKAEKLYGDKGISKGKIVKKMPGEEAFIVAGDISTSGVNSEAKDIIVVKVNESGEWIY